MIATPGLWHTHPHVVAPALLLLLLQVCKAKRNMHNAADRPVIELASQHNGAGASSGRAPGQDNRRRCGAVVLILSGRQQHSQLAGTPAKMCQH
jgi:hypothetical protein